MTSHTLGVWARLEEQLGLVSMRPRLSEDVRIRHIGEEAELVQVGTRRVLPLGAEDVEVVRRFDGEQTIAEIIVAGMGSGHGLAVEPVLSLVDKLVRSEMLDQYPPDLYRQIVNHLRRIAGEATSADAAPAPVATKEEAAPVEPAAEPRASSAGPWRARSPLHADRARFLRGVSLFAELDMQSIGALVDNAHEENWKAKAPIVSEGGRGDRFFIVRSGEVHVEKRDEQGNSRGVAVLGPGDWFGEAALLADAPRNATVRAGEERDVQLYSFDDDVFERYIRPHVTADRGAGLISRRRSKLEEVPVFRALAPDDLDRLARVLREIEAPKGTVLFRQGDPADAFYVIIAGSVGVVKDGSPIAKLVAGEFFGETALLFTDERTATIATTEDSRLWILERDSFQTFIRDALLHRRDLMPTVLNRISSSDPV